MYTSICRIVRAAFLAGLFSLPLTAAANINDAVIKDISQKLASADNQERIKAARLIYEWGGFSDETLFDSISQRLKADFKTIDVDDNKKADEYAWYVKALMASSDTKYLPLIDQVSNKAINPNLRRHAHSALEWEPYFKEWNNAFKNIPFNSSTHDRLRVNAYKALLNSENPEIRKAVYRRIYEYAGITDPTLYAQIADELRSTLKVVKFSRLEADQAAWKVKALSASGSNEFISLYQQLQVHKVTTKSSYGKVRKQARAAPKNTENFAKWNAVLAHSEHEINSRDPRLADWLDLMVYGETQMKTYAIRRSLGYDVCDEVLNEQIRQILKATYLAPDMSAEMVDMQAWACRWLGHFKSEENKQVLEDIVAKSPSRKVISHAKKSLLEYQ